MPMSIPRALSTSLCQAESSTPTANCCTLPLSPEQSSAYPIGNCVVP